MSNRFNYSIFILLLILQGKAQLLAQNAPLHTRDESKLKKEFPYNIDLRDQNSKIYNSSTLFSKSKEPIVLLFWLTTCGPCKLELAAVTKKYEEWQKVKKFKLFAISTDFVERSAIFDSRVKESQWPFLAFHDVRREFSRVMPGELNGLPQVFVLDKNGNIKYQHRRFIAGDEDVLFEEIKKVK